MVNNKFADWQIVTFDEAFTDITAKAKKVEQSEFLISGKYPIVDQSQNFIAGYLDNEELVWGDDLPVVIFGDHTRILKYINFPFVLGADGTKVLKPNKDIYPLFAYYQLLSLDIPSAGYSRHFKFLKDFSFRYPPLTEQKRIASLLGRADRLRQLRRTAHALGESLLQAVFLEMFGETKKKKKIILGEISQITSGVTKGQNYNNRKTVEVPYLRVANVQDGYLDLSEIKTIQALPSEVEELRLQVGDIVMTEGGDFDKLGRGAIWRGQIENCIHQNHIFRVRLNKKIVLPEFFENYLLSFDAKKYFLGASKQTTNLASINMTQLKQLHVPIYPLSLQEEFASVAARIEQMRARQAESQRQVMGLFEALLAESFGG